MKIVGLVGMLISCRELRLGRGRRLEREVLLRRCAPPFSLLVFLVVGDFGSYLYTDYHN